MSGRFAKSLLVPVAMLAAFLAMNVALVWAQHGSEGTVTVTVLDPSGSVIPGAQLELRDLATNTVRKVQTQPNGTYTFVSLLVGKYRASRARSITRWRCRQRRRQMLPLRSR